MQSKHGIALPSIRSRLNWRRFLLRRPLLVFVLGLLLIGGVTKPTYPAVPTPPATISETAADARSNARVFDTVCRLVERKYYDPKLRGANWAALTERLRREALTATDETTLYNVINRLLGSLQDQHTFAVPPTRAREERQGARVGLGIQLRKVEGRWVITRVLGGSAAQDAGLRPGWLIVEIDGRPFDGFNPGQTFRVGQSVRLKLLDADDHPRRVEVICRAFATTPEQRARLLPEGLLYLRFSEFAPKTASWIEEQIRAHPHVTGLILDLRENTGGLLDALANCLRLIYQQDVVFGDFIQRNQKPLRMRIRGNRSAFTGAVIVLTDENSASAAEIFAAAIQDTQRGLVIGRRTSGAVLASIQEALPDGGKLQISIRDYRTVRGVRLEGRGVTPDIVVNLTLHDLRRNVDVDLQEALAHSTSRPPLPPPSPAALPRR
ncbi:MAG: S41 family peptidase [Chloracidobacterium sp.]|nr:S41 family peptidase [Chloracidobacterium sp.]MDW8216349.1 S41 family peptidase [Acidobacteriota bacterium]